MANFFTDTPDLLFYFEHGGVEVLADTIEEDYADAETYPEAPQDTADAVDSYRRILQSLGGLAADFIAPRAEEVDRQGCTLDENGEVRLPRGLVEDLDMLTKAELMGFTLPRAYQGLRLPGLIYTMAIEIVSRADASLMNLFGLQGVAETINDFADEEAGAELLPISAPGTTVLAVDLEPNTDYGLEVETYNGVIDFSGLEVTTSGDSIEEFIAIWEDVNSLNIRAVPEPGAVLQQLSGFATLAALAWRRRKLR